MSEKQAELTTFLTDIAMGESARGHDGRFWHSDWVAGEILFTDLDGTVEVAARPTSFPFCFDWLADGTMVVTNNSGLERLVPGERDRLGDLAALTNPLTPPLGRAPHGAFDVHVDAVDARALDRTRVHGGGRRPRAQLIRGA